MDKARGQWYWAIANVSMNEKHKQKSIEHWNKLNQDFNL